MRSLLDSGRPEGIASLPLLGEVGVFGDHLGHKAVVAVFAGPGDGVEEVGYRDRAKGDVESGLSSTHQSVKSFPGSISGAVEAYA